MKIYSKIIGTLPSHCILIIRLGILPVDYYINKSFSYIIQLNFINITYINKSLTISWRKFCLIHYATKQCFRIFKIFKFENRLRLSTKSCLIKNDSTLPTFESRGN